MRRTYYDHEEAYRRILAAGGRGWDDLDHAGRGDSYDALDGFLSSPLCPDPRGARAIDLGCGGGQAAMRLARRGFLTTGVDFSPTAIRMARENAAERGLRLALRVADCLDLSGFETASFDLAVDNHTLHCILGDDRARFLAEAVRILKPGGTLFCETMTAEGKPDLARMNVDPLTRVDAHRTRYWVKRSELVEELSEAGFVVRDIRARRQPDDPYPGDTLAVVAIAHAHEPVHSNRVGP